MRPGICLFQLLPTNMSENKNTKKPKGENAALQNPGTADIASRVGADRRRKFNAALQLVEMSEGSKPNETPKGVPLKSTFVATGGHHVEGLVICVNISETTCLMAVGKLDCLVYIFGLKLIFGEAEAEWITDGGFDLIGHIMPATRGAFSPDRKSIVTWSPDLVLRQWSLESRQCVGVYTNTHSHVSRILFEPESSLFATIDELGYAFIWMKDEGLNNKLRYVDKKYYPHALTACGFHPKRSYLVTGSDDAKVRMWSMSNGSTAARYFLGHKATITALAFSKCAGFLVAGADDGHLIVWSVMNQLMLRSLNHHSGAITSIGFSPNNGRFAVGSMDTQMSVWDFKLLVRTKILEGVNVTSDVLVGSRASGCGPIFEVRFVSDTHLIAICVHKPAEANESEGDSSLSYEAMEAEEPEESELETEEEESIS